MAPRPRYGSPSISARESAPLTLAASGLLNANVPATTATRANQALPVSKTALVQATPAKLPVGCFVPVANGKLAKVADLRKANAACAKQGSPAVAGAVGGGLFGAGSSTLTSTLVSTAVGVGASVGITQIINNNSNKACINANVVSPC